MSSDDSLYTLLNSPNRTEVYQSCQQARLNPNPGATPEQLTDTLVRNTQPSEEDPLQAIDNIRCAIDAFLTANWERLQMQVSCPAVDRTILACGKCVDAQVLSCFDQNARLIRPYLVPLRRKHMTEVPFLSLEETIEAFTRASEPVDTQFTIVGRLRASHVGAAEIGSILSTPATMEAKARRAWEVIAARSNVVEVKQPKEKNTNMAATAKPRARRPAVNPAPVQQELPIEEELLEEEVAEEGVAAEDDGGYAEPEVADLPPPPPAATRTPANRTTPARTAATAPAVTQPAGVRRPAAAAPVAPPVAAAPAGQARRPQGLAPVQAASTAPAPATAAAGRRPAAPAAAAAAPVAESSGGCSESIIAALRGPLLEHQATANDVKKQLSALTQFLQVMNTQVQQVQAQNILLMKAVAYLGFAHIVDGDVSVVPIEQFKELIVSVQNEDLPADFFPKQ